MSMTSWIRSLRLHWLSRSSHWANVMAAADALEAEHDGEAVNVAHDHGQEARSPEARRLLDDVETELRRRTVS